MVTNCQHVGDYPIASTKVEGKCGCGNPWSMVFECTIHGTCSPLCTSVDETIKPCKGCGDRMPAEKRENEPQMSAARKKKWRRLSATPPEVRSAQMAAARAEKLAKRAANAN